MQKKIEIPELEDEKVKYITGDFRNGLTVFIVYQNDRHYQGLVNDNGKIIVPARYNDINKFSEELASINNWGFNSGFIDLNGNEIVPAKWRRTKSFSEGLAPVSTGEIGKETFSFINKNGSIVIKTDSPEVYPFSCGLALVSDKSFLAKYGYINKSGAFVIPTIYSTVGNFSENLAFVSKSFWKSKFAIIDTSGKLITGFLFDSAQSFYNKSALVSKKGTYGLINSDNLSFVSIGNFYSMLRINECLYVARKQKKDKDLHILDEQFNLLFTVQGEDIIGCYADFEMLTIKNDGKWGLINYLGDIVAKPKYKKIFQNDWNIGNCYVKGSQNVYINSVGETI